MLDKLKTTLRHSAVYSLGNLANKLVGIILLPLYTKHLTVSDFGILSIFEITILIAVQVLVAGLPQSYLRFAPAHLRKGDHDPLLFTYLFTVAVIAAVAGILLYLAAPWIGDRFSSPALFTRYFRISGGIIAFNILNTFFLSTVRAREKSILFVSANLGKLTLTLVLTILFIVKYNMGITGVLAANLIGNTALLAVLLPIHLIRMVYRLDRSVFREAMLFGIPLIFSGLAHMLLNMGSNYLLKYMGNYEQVGLFNLAYRISGILNVFIIQSYTLGFLPIAYKLQGEPGAQRYYVKMMTYFSLAIIWAWLGISLFSREILIVFSRNPDYWPSAELIPVLTLSFVLGGIRANSALGLYLSGNTGDLARGTVIALLLNVGLNILLIPRWGMHGSAWAAVIAYVYLLAVTQRDASRRYYIPYEFRKLVMLASVGAILFLLGAAIPDQVGWGIPVKAVAFLAFPFFLLPLKFYEEIELLRIRQSVNKWRKPSSWISLIRRK